MACCSGAALPATGVGPVPISNPGLVRELHSLIASEVRARGVHLVLSPVVGAARNFASRGLRPA